MSDKPLAGKKIAILLESEYIPAEIKAYEEHFGRRLGAEVHLLSRLWGDPKTEKRKIDIVSDVDSVIYKNPSAPQDQRVVDLEATRNRLETREIREDFRDHPVTEFAAVLVAANYTSVRLRYFEPEDGAVLPAMVRDAPAVRYIAEAMRTPGVVVGALCHGLWLLAPVPELLAARRVICHEVMLADVLNAGAEYVPPLTADMVDHSGWEDGSPIPSTVVTDGDLVTGRWGHDVVPYIYAIRDRILGQAQPAPETPPTVPPKKSEALKRILVVLSEHGYWGEELVGPVEVFYRQGYEVDFATPTGIRPRALAPSMDPDFYDPPLRRPVTTPEMAAKVRKWDDMSSSKGPESKRLDNPISLASWLPERPYYAASQLVRGLESYHRKLDKVRRDIAERYDCLLIVGGSGPIVDLANNQRVHDLILAFLDLANTSQTSKPVAAECYGVACLAFACDPQFRQSIIRGKRVTGHCLEYDYKDGTGFLDPATADKTPEAAFVPFNMGPPPYPLELLLRRATEPGGEYIGNFGKDTSVIVDYPFVTGRSTPDATLTGEMIVEVLERNLKRYGW